MDLSSNSSSGKAGAIEAGRILFERYQVLKLIGAGASGSVYQCRDLAMGTQIVAMKVFPARFAKDEKLAARLSREIRAAHVIEHDNVVKFYECLRDEELIVYTMEYIEGVTLRAVMNDPEPLDLGQVVSHLSQIARGLRAIHEADIIHRDVKPGNILISSDNLIKITDFGVARKFEDPRESMNKELWSCINDSFCITEKDITSDGYVVGTPYYLSPEYLTKGQFDKRSDIYALGVIGYELITGEEMFSFDSLPELLNLKVYTDPDPPTLINPDCPEILSSAVMKAMDRNPDHRYQDLSGFIHDLNLLYGKVGQASLSYEEEIEEDLLDHSGPEISSGRIRRSINKEEATLLLFRSPRTLIIIVVVTVLSLVTLFSYLYWSWIDSQSERDGVPGVVRKIDQKGARCIVPDRSSTKIIRSVSDAELYDQPDDL
jgi:serine/threonine protein kinase